MPFDEPALRTLAAEVLAGLVESSLTARRQARFGLFLEDLPEFDPAVLLTTLSRGGEPPALRVSLLGWPEAMAGAAQAWRAPAGGRRLEVAISAQQANAWRDAPLTPEAGPQVVVVQSDDTMVRSLRTAYLPLGSADFKEALADHWQRRGPWSAEHLRFWQAVVRRPDIPAEMLLEYLAALSRVADEQGPAGVLKQAPRLLYLLHLIPQPGLFDARSDAAVGQLLRRNIELRQQLRDSDLAGRSRLLAAAKDDAMAADALAFARDPQRERLQPLDYDRVREIWSTKQPAKNGSDEPRRPRPRSALGDQLVVEALLAGELDEVRARADELDRQLLGREPVEDEVEEPSGPQSLSIQGQEYTPRSRADQGDTAALCQRVFTVEQWGGVATTAAVDLPTAVGDGAGLAVKPFTPAADDWPEALLRKAAAHHRPELNQAAGVALAAWQACQATRSALLPKMAGLVDHPLLALVCETDLASRADAHLASWEALLAALPAVREALRQINATPSAKKLAARVLLLDTLVLQVGETWHAVAGPLHPFHLWQWRMMAEALGAEGLPDGEEGRRLLRELVATPPTVAPSLAASPFALDGLTQARTLLPAGRLAALPVFAEPQARLHGADGAAALGRLAERLLRLQPHAAQGLSVVLIDPPALPEVLTGLLDGAERRIHPQPTGGRTQPVAHHVRVWRTRSAPEATAEATDRLADWQRELQEHGGDLTIEDEPAAWDEVLGRLDQRPAHLTAVFDPGTAQDTVCNVTVPPPAHPLVIPRAYEYNDFEDRIQVVPASSGGLFTAYHQLFADVLSRPSTDFVGRSSGAATAPDSLRRLAASTAWLVLLDRGLDPTLSLARCLRLESRLEGGRDVAAFTAQRATIEAVMEDALRQAGLPPHPDTVNRLLTELWAYGSESLMRLLRPVGKGSSVEPRQAKALIGTLRLTQWYAEQYPESLVVSLDADATRRWLGGDDDQQRADLLAVRPDNDPAAPPVVEVIEVKTHEQGQPVHEAGGGFHGQAVEQVEVSLLRLRRILEASAGIGFDAARRAVLQDQLYRALAVREFSAATRAGLVAALQRIFGPGPVDWRGLVAEVRIEAGRRAVPGLQGPKPSPQGFDIRWLTVVEGGDGEFAAVTPPAAPAPGLPDQAPPTAVPVPVAEAGGRTEPFRVLIGHDVDGGALAWEPDELSNFGVQVTGESGAGKTQFVRALIAEAARAGFPLTVLDFKNDYSGEFAEQTGLRVYDVAADRLPFNPLALLPGPDGLLHPRAVIVDTAGVLTRVLGLGPQQEAALRGAFETAFSELGVPPRERDYRATAPPPAPGFDRVLELLSHDPDNVALTNRLDLLLDYLPGRSDDSGSFEQLMAQQAVLSLNGVREDLRNLLAELIILRLHELALRGDQPRRLTRLLVFDEARRLSGSERLVGLASEGRAFGVGLVVAAQMSSQIDAQVSFNLATKLFFRAGNTDALKVAATLVGNPSSADGRQVVQMAMHLKSHQALVTNQRHSPYALVATVPHYQRA